MCSRRHSSHDGDFARPHRNQMQPVIPVPPPSKRRNPNLRILPGEKFLVEKFLAEKLEGGITVPPVPRGLLPNHRILLREKLSEKVWAECTRSVH